jgi:hypothetical protein
MGKLFKRGLQAQMNYQIIRIINSFKPPKIMKLDYCGVTVTLSKALDASSLYRPIYPLDMSAVLL